MNGYWQLKIYGEFSAAHALRNYNGKCEHLHGHNFKVEATVQGKELDPATGMMLDFSILKRYLANVLASLDHAVLNDMPPFDIINPSSENLAKYIWEQFCKKLAENIEAQDRKIFVAEVGVAEKDAQKAIWVADHN